MRYFPNNFYIIRLVWKYCPGRIIAEFLIRAVDYVSWIFYSIIFLKYILHSLETSELNGSYHSFLTIMVFLISAAVVFGCLTFAKNYYQYIYKPKTDTILYEKINRMIFDKASDVDLSCYETVDFYNRLTLAMKDAGEKIASVLEISASVILGIAASAFSLYYMFEIDHFVIFFVAGPLIGNFIFGRKLNQKEFEQAKENVPYQRRMDYVNRTIYLADYAKEIRMSPVFFLLRKIYETGYDGVQNMLKNTRIVRFVCLYCEIFSLFSSYFRELPTIPYTAYLCHRPLKSVILRFCFPPWIPWHGFSSVSLTLS